MATRHLQSICTLGTFLWIFFFVWKGRNAQPISTLEGSNDAKRWEKVPFGGLIDENIDQGTVSFPKTPMRFFKYENSTKSKSRITLERQGKDKKFQRPNLHNRAFTNRMVTSFRSRGPIVRDRNRRFHHYGRSKKALNFQMVHARQEICIER